MAVEVAREGSVAVVTVSRPAALNALNAQTVEELSVVVQDLASDAAIGAVMLTGAGDKAFVAGADIAEMQSFNAEQARAFSARGQALMDAIEAAPQPWIAAVNGFALGGGCELALACDIRLACESASFAQPEIDLGVTPGFGGTQRLPRHVGQGWAKYLVLSGRRIGAAEALRIGLVQAVVPDGTLFDEAHRLAVHLARKSPAALRAGKAAVLAAAECSGAGQEIERGVFAAAFGSPDQREGMAAFLAHRRPRFERS